MATALADVQRLAGDLTPADQARLLQFLAPRVAAAVIDPEPTPTPAERAAAWARVRALGDRIAAAAQPGESITDEVCLTRR